MMSKRETIQRLLELARGPNAAAMVALGDAAPLTAEDVLTLGCALAVERVSGSVIGYGASLDGEAITTGDGRSWDVTSEIPVELV